MKKGDIVNFQRSETVSALNIVIIAVVENHIPLERQKVVMPITYIIEHESGWLPNPIQAAKYELAINKKYLFVSENELTLVN